MNSSRIYTRLQYERLAARSAEDVAKADRRVNWLFILLGGIAGALLLVHFCAAEGLW